MAELTDAQSRLIDDAAPTSAGSASLSDIQHVVILMQENRSFDNYFGTLPGVRGFSDPDRLGQVFDQFGYRFGALPGRGAPRRPDPPPQAPSAPAGPIRPRRPHPPPQAPSAPARAAAGRDSNDTNVPPVLP